MSADRAVTSAAARPSPGGVPFALWAVVGAGVSTGISVIGVFGVPIALVLAALLLTVPRRDGRAAVGAVAGAGLLPLLVAWLNRDGPGTVCRAVGSGGQECIDEWSPWPWLAAGVVLVGVGVALFVVLRRSAPGGRTAGTTGPPRAPGTTKAPAA